MSVSKQNGSFVVACGLVILAGVACKKKSDSEAAPPHIEPVPAVDAAGPPATDAGPAEVVPPAAGEAGVGASAAGPSLLAGLFGGAGRVAAGAPAGSAAAPGLAMMRDVGKSLLDQEQGGAFGRALSAARVAQSLPDANKRVQEMSPPVLPGDPPPDEPTGTGSAPANVPNPTDPCAKVVPALSSCLAETLGEAVGPEEINQMLEDCRAKVSAWPEERQLALAACAAQGSCETLFACVEGFADGEEPPDEGPEPPPPPPPPLADGDFCEKMIQRVVTCVDPTFATPETMAPMIEECRTSFAETPAGTREELAACIGKPCEEVFECMGAMGASGATQPPSGTEDSAGMAVEVFGEPPDPAQVAALPADSRNLCDEIATGMDRCFDTMLGSALGGEAPDPSVQSMMAELRAQILPGMRNLCLTAAISGGSDFEQIRAARSCFAGPCEQAMACLQGIEATL